MKNRFFFVFIAFLLFLVSSIFITFPLIFHLGDYATGRGDELLIAWIQAWDLHALFSNPLHLFNANILFPYPNTLAYSDIFLTGSLLTFLPTYLIGQPIVANNFMLIFSLVFLGFSLYLLAHYITKNFFASLLAGTLAIFSPATLSFTVHLQVLDVALVPLSLLFFLLFFDSKKTRYLVFSLLCFLLQMYNSFLPGYFILFAGIIILAFKWVENKKLFKQLVSFKNITLIVITFLLIIPVVIPYFQVSREFNYVRDIRDSIHFAIQPEDMLYSSTSSRLYPLLNNLPFNQVSQNNEFKPGYLGFIFTLLVLYSVYYLIRNKNRKKSVYAYIFASIALLGFILSLGPFLHLGRHTIHKPFPIPLPYYLFYYSIPGFQGMRNSARWEMLFILASSIVVALIIHKSLDKRSFKFKILVYLLLFLGIIGEYNFPMQFVSIPQKKNFPKVYSWMATTPKDAKFIEMPIYNWSSTQYVQQEMLREYYSTENFRKIVNGYSGFSPPPWQDFIADMHKHFPSNESVKKIQDLGVQYIIINKSDFDYGYKTKFEKYNGEEILKALDKNHSLTLVKKFDTYYVFTFDVKK